MNCPKCGFARPLADSVCRRCKYVFDEDRFLALMPPRAKGGGKPGRFFAERTWLNLGGVRSLRGLPTVASLIPGLGHVIQGRPWVGLLYAILVSLFFGLSFASFGQTAGQMLFGAAVSTHASCILDTTRWARSPEVRPRMFAMAAILAGLVALYWPLAIHLSERFVVAVQREVDRPRWRPIQALSIDQILIMAALFVATIVVSAWLGGKLSAKES
jgi:hypothetical protein